MTKTVGQRIEDLARARDMPTGRPLAVALGVNYETLRKWRLGLTAPTRARADEIGKLLGVPPAVFMHGAAEAGSDIERKRLLSAFDRILPSDRRRFLAEIEARADDVEQIAVEIGVGRAPQEKT